MADIENKIDSMIDRDEKMTRKLNQIVTRMDRMMTNDDKGYDNKSLEERVTHLEEKMEKIDKRVSMIVLALMKAMKKPHQPRAQVLQPRRS